MVESYLYSFAARMRPTEVRPISKLRAISDLLTPARPQRSDFNGLGRRCGRPTQSLPVLPGMGQAGAHPFLQNLPFERGENRQ